MTVNRLLIGMGILDPTVGAFRSNTEMVIAAAAGMTNANVAIGVFSEQLIGGYCPEDLTLFPDFVSGQWQCLQEFMRSTAGSPTIFAVGLLVAFEEEVYNAVALVHSGKILAIIPKELLPTYGVFRDGRTLTPLQPGFYGEIDGVPFGDIVLSTDLYGTLTACVCEDVWSADNPLQRRDALINLVVNGSPFRSGVTGTREEMLPTRSADTRSLLVYVNQFGGNDSLVYDGGGYIYSAGKLLYKASRFKSGVYLKEVSLAGARAARAENTTLRLQTHGHGGARVINVRLTTTGRRASVVKCAPLTIPRSDFLIPSDETPELTPREKYFEDLLRAMITGLDGYFRKTGAFKRMLVLNSGGYDSMLATYFAYLWACEQFKHLTGKAFEDAVADALVIVTMPSRFNSETTQGLAKQICDECGLNLMVWPIQEEFESATADLAGVVQGTSGRITRLLEQNMQARIRGKRAWDLSTAFEALWINTGNQTEGDNGYCTVGADVMGAYAPFRNLLKSVLIELVRYIAFNEDRHGLKSFQALLNTKASAELDENQSDENELGPFVIIDRVALGFFHEKKRPVEIYLELRDDGWSDVELLKIAPNYKPGMLKVWIEKTIRRFFISRYKAIQGPQGVHLGSFDTDPRRSLEIPVVTSEQWMEGMFRELHGAP